MAKQARGSNWPEDEIKNLIDIWKEPEMRQKIDSKKRSKTDIWCGIATRLFHLGYPERTGHQIHNKIKDLRRSYYKAQADRDHVGPSGSGAAAGPALIRQFPYYFMLHEVIGNRPRPNVNAPAGTVGESVPSSFECDDDSSNDALDTSSSNSTRDRNALSDEECDQNEDRKKNEQTQQNEQTKQIDKSLLEFLEKNKNVEGFEMYECNVPDEELQVRETGQQLRKGKKRQRLSMKDRTVEALAKKMKEITAVSDRKFMAIEERRRREELEQRREDRKCMLSIMELIKQGMEDRKHAEEKRSRDLQALMAVLSRNSPNNHATTSHNACCNQDLTDNTPLFTETSLMTE